MFLLHVNIIFIVKELKEGHKTWYKIYDVLGFVFNTRKELSVAVTSTSLKVQLGWAEM